MPRPTKAAAEFSKFKTPRKVCAVEKDCKPFVNGNGRNGDGEAAKEESPQRKFTPKEIFTAIENGDMNAMKFILDSGAELEVCSTESNRVRIYIKDGSLSLSVHGKTEKFMEELVAYLKQKSYTILNDKKAKWEAIQEAKQQGYRPGEISAALERIEKSSRDGLIENNDLLISLRQVRIERRQMR